MKRNAFFQLIQKTDGMYLKSYPAVEGGDTLSVEDILNYLDLKRIQDVGISEVKQFVTQSSREINAEVKIMPGEHLPEKEFAIVTIDDKNLMAKVRLYPPSNNGARLTCEELCDLIEQSGVQNGLIKKNVDLLLKARLYCTDVLVAKATMPIQGKSAEIIYNFDVDKTSSPALSEDGSVDFHKLDMIESVNEGQLLATLIPIDYGTPGTDVTGKQIKPASVKNKRLKHGKNIHLSDDKLQMFSEVSGNVTLVNDTVFVSDVYDVPGDVGPSTGDIEYDGSVEVKGNVLTGYTIRAAGDITVNGAVEGAVLIADGKIILKRGIQGMGKGTMEAKGDVIANFIESSTVKSGGSVITDAIMHSHVDAQGNIVVYGKRGIIAGGSVSSTTKIEMKVAGSTMGTTTELEVGVDPSLIDRYHAIEKHMEMISDEKERILQNLQILQKRLKTKGTLDKDKMTMLKESTERLKQIDVEMEEDTNEYEEIDDELARTAGGGKIIVEDVAYPGVKLTISNVVSFIHTETQHSAFVREGADIRVRGI